MTAGHFVSLIPGHCCGDGKLQEPVAFSVRHLSDSVLRCRVQLHSSFSPEPRHVSVHKNMLQQTLTGDLFIPTCCSSPLFFSLYCLFQHTRSALSVSDGLPDLKGLHKLLRIRLQVCVQVFNLNLCRKCAKRRQACHIMNKTRTCCYRKRINDGVV